MKNILGWVVAVTLPLCGFAQSAQPIRLINSKGVLAEAGDIKNASGPNALKGSGTLEQIARENPATSPYKILEKLYNASRGIPQLSEFDLDNVKEPNLICVAAWTDSPTPVDYPFFHSVVDVGGKNLPAKGPLFPPVIAIPNYKDVLLPLAGHYKEELLSQKLSWATVEEISVTSTDLSVKFGKTPDYNLEKLELKFRKNGELISFYQHWVPEPWATGVQELVSYGYCYHQ